jgi:histidyl-tRNA synthetase
MSTPIGIPKGTRDFAPDVMRKRNYLFGVIRTAFEKYGFQPLETPSMENLSTLTGKYGEEGDQLIFKILNNGDFLKDVASEKLSDSRKLSFEICDRALRYDLTVPFARFVAMNRNSVVLPFRRYQIQPVWRADRPQRGRFREFYQCDADVVGTDSLWVEVELVQLFDEVLSNLNLPGFSIVINNRKILAGIAEATGVADKFMGLTVVLDKWDKIGEEAVQKELSEMRIPEETFQTFKTLNGLSDFNDKMNFLKSVLGNSETGLKGIEEMTFVWNEVEKAGLNKGELVFDVSLARGLNYYTGAIFEVKAKGIQMGSICGGGRYDDLTGIFGWKGVSGVGISFGADRIFEVLSELNLFPESATSGTQVLLVQFGGETTSAAFQLLKQIRNAGISCEMYPDDAKLKKQFKYADDNKIPFVVVVGEDEVKSSMWQLRNMVTGDQQAVSTVQLVGSLSS